VQSSWSASPSGDGVACPVICLGMLKKVHAAKTAGNSGNSILSIVSITLLFTFPIKVLDEWFAQYRAKTLNFAQTALKLPCKALADPLQRSCRISGPRIKTRIFRKLLFCSNKGELGHPAQGDLL
jgi:hypothetical protein